MNQQEIAQYALDNLIKAGADKAACTVSCGRKEEFNVEAGKFSLLRTLFDDSLSLKALCGNRKGVTVINKLEKASIDKAIEDCISLAKSSLPDEAEDIAEKLENKTFDHHSSGADLDRLFERSKEFVEHVRDEYPKIILEGMTADYNTNQIIYLNSNGVVFNENKDYYSMSSMFSANDGEKASSFNFYEAAFASPDTPFADLGMHSTLLAESVKSLDTRMVGGKYVGKVIITPACGVIWDTILSCFISDRPLIEGTSRWKDALGTKIADSKLTMSLAPLHPGIIAGERFTSDGYESKNTDLIRDGVLSSFALSLYGSRKTGHPRSENTAFYNIEVAPGDTSLAEMIKGIDKGIVLNRFSGASPGPSGDVSGVAKNSFMIENGVITDALSETMVSFNIVDILGNIPAISKERCENGTCILPWTCFDGITISGK
ncbi:MAG: TldD/PmbA family protein [Oscillospiraceae bacterium]|nr:TldD/PmbA family protein [Oscillospiraceae bacterium]